MTKEKIIYRLVECGWYMDSWPIVAVQKDNIKELEDFVKQMSHKDANYMKNYLRCLKLSHSCFQ